MHKKAELRISDILSLGFGGIFALATVFLAHDGSGWAFLTFLITVLAWIPSMSSAMTIATVFAISGFAEILIFENSILGLFWLVISAFAYFVPHAYHMSH